MNRMVRCLASLPLLFVSSVSAEPVVLLDTGVGVPTADYVRIFQGNRTPDFRKSWLFKTAEENGVTNEIRSADDLYPCLLYTSDAADERG